MQHLAIWLGRCLMERLDLRFRVFKAGLDWGSHGYGGRLERVMQRFWGLSVVIPARFVYGVGLGL